MNWIRRSAWLIALLPAIAALAFVGLAARFPEPLTVRAGLHEPSTQWSPATPWSSQHWLQFAGEPAQPVQRVLLLGPLQIPGMTLQWAAGAMALLALLIAWFGSRLVRRTAGTTGMGTAFAFGGIAFLCCSPAFGADWLHAERVGLFTAPLLLLAGLALLQGERHFVWRMLLVLLLVVAAPLCHDHGVLVGLALAPAIVESAQRSGASRWLWMGVTLTLGIAASVLSFYPAGGLHGQETGLMASLAAAPGAHLLDLLAGVGGSWLDLWPEHRLDELALGCATILLLCGMPFLPTLAGARSAAPWWSCAVFGLLLVPWTVGRHGFDLEPWFARELSYGAFLLPIGCLGLLASRLGSHAWSIGLGALTVLSLQDWLRGIESLRAAQAESVRVEASLLVPEPFVDHRVKGLAPFATAEQEQELVARGWVPAVVFDWQAAAAAAQLQPVAGEHGMVVGGSPAEMHGMVRSSLVTEPVGAVFLVLLRGESTELVGVDLPRFAGRGRDAQWRIQCASPAAEGDRLMALGLQPKTAKFVRIGAAMTVRDGALVVAN